MFLHSQVNSFNTVLEFGLTTFTTTPGISVTPGASSTKGSWTSVGTPSNDVYGIYLQVSGGATSSQIKMHQMDIGIDPSGGTSFTVVIPDILCGASSTSPSARPHQFYFPFYVKSGSNIAIRVQGSNATAGTVRIYGKLFCNPSNPAALWVGTYAQTIGLTSGTAGTTISYGNGSWGSWTSIGTTSRDLNYWQFCTNVNSTTSGTGARLKCSQLAYGDGTNFTPIFEWARHGLTVQSTPLQTGTMLLNGPHCYRMVPAGSTLYVRGATGGADVSTHSVAIVGIG